MSILIRKYSALDETKWDNFIQSSLNGTIFHLRKFLSYHINRKFIDHSLLFIKNNFIISIFPAVEIMENSEKVLYSHPGASYGGFVYNDISYADAEEIINLIDIYCINNNFKKIFFVSTPIIYNSKTNDTLNYLLHRHSFEIAECYISSVIEINKNDNPINYLNKRKKRYIQNYFSDENLTIKQINDFDNYYPILLSNKQKHNILPTHSLEELKRLNNLFPQKLHLLLLYHNQKIIGGALNIIANEFCGILFYNMIDYEYKKLQPATIQIFESIKWAQKEGLKFLDLGVSQKPKSKNPMEPHKDLITFKEQFGSMGILRIAFKKTY